jgi:hypothetical protein
LLPKPDLPPFLKTTPIDCRPSSVKGKIIHLAKSKIAQMADVPLSRVRYTEAESLDVDPRTPAVKVPQAWTE